MKNISCRLLSSIFLLLILLNLTIISNHTQVFSTESPHKLINVAIVEDIENSTITSTDILVANSQEELDTIVGENLDNCNTAFTVEIKFVDSSEIKAVLENALYNSIDDYSYRMTLVKRIYYDKGYHPSKDVGVYNFTYKVNQSQNEEAREMASDIVDDIITPDMDEEERVEAINDWIKDNIVTINFGDEHAYFAFKDGVGNCNAYTSAFKLLCDEAGIESEAVFNSDLTHSWAMAKICDRWFHYDTPWGINGRSAENTEKVQYHDIGNWFFNTTLHKYDPSLEDYEEGICDIPLDDTDSDGHYDIYDECPDNPLLYEKGGCGCDTTDDDSDGIYNCLEADTDGDGVIDDYDACPTNADLTEMVCDTCTPLDSNDNDIYDCLETDTDTSTETGIDTSIDTGIDTGTDTTTATDTTTDTNNSSESDSNGSSSGGCFITLISEFSY